MEIKTLTERIKANKWKIYLVVFKKYTTIFIIAEEHYAVR